MEKDEYWFKRRRYGYGWTPVTWQGWMSILIYGLIIVADVVFLVLGSRDNVGLFVLIVLLATTSLILISYVKGPSPRWRWGTDEDDDPAKDF